MPASASLTIPIQVRTPGQAEEVAAIFAAAVGASDIAVDATAGKATLRYHFPGDIDTIMRQLYARGLANSATLGVAIAVQSANGALPDSAQLLAKLKASPAVTNASFDGRVVAATVAAATQTLRDLHEHIVAAGLSPH